jgi:hypothetical protein
VRFDACCTGKGSGVQPSLLTRLRWRLEELRHLDDTKVIGGLLLIVALTLGGFLAARAVSRTSANPRAATRMVTIHQKVRVLRHGHVVTRWRVRRLAARAQTVLQTQTVRTPNGVRLVTHPVTRYRVVYRKHQITAPGRTQIQTQTVTRQVTDSQVVTVTHRVTVVNTTTVVSTVTDTVPVTITVTVPTP